MALSMDEQRMLAEIERRLVAEDPRLAARLVAFRRPGAAGRLRTRRSRIVAGFFSVALAAVISLTVYAMLPLRTHAAKTGGTTTTSSSQAPAHPEVSAPRTPAAASSLG